MANATDHWMSFKTWEEDETQIQRIMHVLCIADFTFLCNTALDIRSKSEQNPEVRKRKRGATTKPLTCTVDTTKFTAGMANLVLELKLSDRESWIVRIRFPNDESDDEELSKSMISEVTTMKYIRANTSIPVPKVYGYDLSPSNAFGFRYVLMEMLPGRILDHDSKYSIPKDKWTALADQLAGNMYQLSQLRFSSIGRLLPPDENHSEELISPIDGEKQVTTSLEYFFRHRQNHSHWIRSEHEGDKEWATAAWILEQAVPAMLVPEWLHGQFPLCHTDLHLGNILIDDDFNITGIIDWSNVQTAPIERFTIMPDIATFHGADEHLKARIECFRKALKEGLRKREVEGRKERRDEDEDEEMPLISDSIGTSRWEIIYRCCYSYHWRALTDAKLVMEQMYGSQAKWEDFVEFCKNAPIHAKRDG